MWNDKVTGLRYYLRNKEYKLNHQRVEVCPVKNRSELQDVDANATSSPLQGPAKSDPSILYQMDDLTSFNSINFSLFFFLQTHRDR